MRTRACIYVHICMHAEKGKSAPLFFFSVSWRAHFAGASGRRNRLKSRRFYIPLEEKKREREREKREEGGKTFHFYSPNWKSTYYYVKSAFKRIFVIRVPTHKS